MSLESLKGSGPGGRVVLADVERAAGKEPQRETSAPSAEAEPRRKSVKIRRIVGRKMVESWTQAPHFFVTVAVDMTDVIRFRQDLGRVEEGYQEVARRLGILPDGGPGDFPAPKAMQ